MYAHVFKDSEASKKAWATRRGKAAVASGAKKPLKTRLSKEIPAKSRKVMAKYMDGFTSKLKNPSEKAYAEARAKQMVSGEARPDGMSARFGLTKQRAVLYEILIAKIFKAGRAKHGI